MKHVQVIDGADNCVYDVYAIDDEDFRCLFREGQDIAFIDEVLAVGDPDRLEAVFARLWNNASPSTRSAACTACCSTAWRTRRLTIPTEPMRARSIRTDRACVEVEARR
jgi:hypothetical protein